MALLRRLYGRLRLTVNESKSAVADVKGRKFLGYCFWFAKDEVKRVRELIRRNGGRSMQEVIERLRPYLLGWKAYFGLAQTPGVWCSLNEWLRHRLRAIQLKHRKRGTTMYPALCPLGGSPRCGPANRCQQPPMVAQQRSVAQQRLGLGMVRPFRLAPSLLTLTPSNRPVRRRNFSKPDSCTERHGIDPTGISVTAGAQYPERPQRVPRGCRPHRETTGCALRSQQRP